jgi:DNA-binding NarL/FixJ family response regulator
MTASGNGGRKAIFIVDDHPVFSDGLSRLLRSELKVDVVGVAFNAVEALQRILKTPCDLALVDVALPGRSGIELARDIHAMRPKTSVLVLSAYDEVLYAERALRSHARGYIMKHEHPMRIVEAVKTVLGGNVWFSQQISAKLFDAMMGRSGAPRTRHPIDRLTDRELEILKLIGEGRRNKDIANRLNLSPKTIDVHRSHIREKLGLQSGPELVCYAAKWADASVGANSAALVVNSEAR